MTIRMGWRILALMVAAVTISELGRGATLRDLASWLTRSVVPIAVFIVLPVFLWYQRDRRKSRAETAVAERTVGSTVVGREVGAMGASVAFVNEAFRVERESKDRQIRALEDEVREVERRCSNQVRELERRIAAKDVIIEELRQEIERLRKLVEG